MKKIVSIMASIFMALALVSGGVFLLHDIEKTSIVQEETSRAEGVLDGDWEDADNIDYAHIVSELNPKISGNTIYIDTAREFALFAHSVSYDIWRNTSGARYRQLNVVLRKTINLSEHWWNTAGSYLTNNENNFAYEGTFDGQGHTIEDMNIEYFKQSECKSVYLGLFGYATGTIKNLSVTGSIYIYNSTNNTDEHLYAIGGIVGRNDAAIQNCTSSVCIYYRRRSPASDNYDLANHVNIGGITGWSNTGDTISNCSYDGLINFNNDNVEVKTYKNSKYRFRLGGIAGCAYNTDFKDCLFNGKILVHEPDDMDQLYIGGIVACYDVSNAQVVDCISKGEISLDGHFENQIDADNDDGGKYCAGAIGGVVGYVYHTYSSATALYIKRCHNFSKINQYTSDYSEFHVGGILGYTRFNTQIYNCSNLGYVFNRWQRWESVYFTGGHIDYNHWIPDNETESVGTGGIVGTTEAVLKVYYCINYGNVSEDSSDVDKGKVDGSNSFNKAVLSYGTGYIGGILGHKRASETSTISYCMNYGSVSSFSGCSTIGTLFGYLKGNVSANHCLSFVSGNICGSDSAVKPGVSNNCDTMTSPSRDGVLNRKNNNSTASFWSGKLCTYYPNVSGDSLNDKLYISPKDNESLIYKHLGTGVTANAIMPLSLLSTTTVTYYCGDDQKFYQNDTNVGRSQRGDWDSSSERYGNALSTYIDRDPDSDYSYPDRILTLRGVGVLNEKIFTCKYYEYNTEEITKTDDFFKNNTEMSVSVSGDNIKASVCGYTNNLGTINIILTPKQKTITVSNPQQGTVTIGGKKNTAKTFTISVDKYKYNPSGGGTSRELSVKAEKESYLVKSISFNSTGKTNTLVENPFSATSDSFTVCDISTITINYVSNSQNVDFYYKLPGEDDDIEEDFNEEDYTLGRECIAGGIDRTNANLIDDVKIIPFEPTVTIPKGIEYEYGNTISLYTNPGYYIKSIKAYKNRAGEYRNIDSSLEAESLQTFLGSKFLDDNWDISAVYIEYDYTQFNTGVTFWKWNGTATTEQRTLDPENKALNESKSIDKTYVSLGYRYDLYAHKRDEVGQNNCDSTDYIASLGRTNSLASSLKLSGLDPQITLVLSDFVGQRVYTDRITGNNTYDANLTQNLYIHLIAVDSGDQLKVADKNMAKYAGKTDKYYQVTNSTNKDNLQKDIYGNPIGGLTYFAESGTNKINTNVSATSAITFSAIAMPGFKFVGIDFTYDGKTALLQTPNAFSPSATAIDVLAKAVQDKFGTNEIYYDQLQNLTVYGYYDVAQYQIEVTKQTDENKETLEPKIIRDYFEEFPLDLSYGEDFEFLGLYLLDGIDEKLLTFDPSYTFINYNPWLVFPNEVYKNLNLEQTEVAGNCTSTNTRYTITEVHEKYFKINAKGDDYYIKSNESTCLRFLVKFATKPTSSSIPPRSNQVVEVSSVKDLIWLSNQVNSGNSFENYIIKQTANIDFGVSNKYCFEVDITELYTGLSNGQIDTSTLQTNVKINAYTFVELLEETNAYYSIVYREQVYYIYKNASYFEVDITELYKRLSNGQIDTSTLQTNVEINAYTFVNLIDSGNNYYLIQYQGNQYYVETSKNICRVKPYKVSQYFSNVDITKLYTGILSNGQIDTNTLQTNVKINAYTSVKLLEETNTYYSVVYQGRKYYIKTPNYESDGNTLYRSLLSPIGTEEHPFKGTYDGQGYVIKNLSLTNGDTAIGTNVGLFGYTDGATIKNLTLVDGSVTGFDNVGAVVGYAKNTTFENVINQSCEVNAITYAYHDIYGDEIEKAESFITDIDSYSFEKVGDVYKSLTYYKNNRAYGGIVGRSENSTFFACGVRAEISNVLKNGTETTVSTSSSASTDLNCQVSVARGIIGSSENATTLNQCYYFGDLSILNENYLTNQGSLQNCIYRNGSSETPYNADTSNTNIWFEIDGKHELKIFYWA